MLQNHADRAIARQLLAGMALLVGAAVLVHFGIDLLAAGDALATTISEAGQ